MGLLTGVDRHARLYFSEKVYLIIMLVVFIGASFHRAMVVTAPEADSS